MVRILFDLQISSYSNNGSPLIQSDSNWIFTASIIEELEKNGHQCKLLYGVRWPLPEKFPCKEVGFIAYHSTQEDRFFIDHDIVREALAFKPDIIWTNDPCRVGAIRTFYDGALVAYNHWIDNPSDPKTDPLRSYYFGQIEAYYKADMLLFNSQAGINIFQQHLPENFYGEKRNALLGAVNPPLRTALIKEVIDRVHYSKVPTIAFNHRLSSAPQYKENVDRFRETTDLLLRNGFEFKVIVSNPSGKEHSLLTEPWVENIHSQKYETYLEKLATAWFQITLFNYHGQWSMAMAEALAMGMKVYHPNHSGYDEMSLDYSVSTPYDIATSIRNHYLEYSNRDYQQSSYYLKKFSPEYIYKEQLSPIIKELS